MRDSSASSAVQLLGPEVRWKPEALGQPRQPRLRHRPARAGSPAGPSGPLTPFALPHVQPGLSPALLPPPFHWGGGFLEALPRGGADRRDGDTHCHWIRTSLPGTTYPPGSPLLTVIYATAYLPGAEDFATEVGRAAPQRAFDGAVRGSCTPAGIAQISVMRATRRRPGWPSKCTRTWRNCTHTHIHTQTRWLHGMGVKTRCFM